jgi:putative transport protein
MRDRAVSPDSLPLSGLGYAVAYPFGVLGIILTMLGLRRLFRIDLAEEGKVFLRSLEAERPRLEALNLEVRAPALQGLALAQVPLPAASGVVFSRVLQGGAVRVATPETRLAVGDTVLAVGPREQLEAARALFGAESGLDLRAVPSSIVARPILVTQKAVLGRRVTELGLQRHGVAITRVQRADVELPVSPEVRLQFGDRLLAVGEPAAIGAAARELGDSLKELNHPMLVPVFLGIALGALIGSWPIPIPGVPAPVKLGLAGGPLLVAIALSRIGRVGPLIWYLPSSANFALREMGISLFLACVGIGSGGRFVSTVAQGDGLKWMLLGAIITAVPIVVVGLAARLVFRLNFMAVCGLLAGSMTDPPALAFATAATGSDGPSICYATVYPLTMFLRVISAQLMVLLLL